ncbi:MAG: hypothetical protein ACYDHZ_04115 [Dehalococcoidia bacterium]
MNRTFSTILMLALALAAIIPAAAPVIADSVDKEKPAASFPAALAIKAPNRVAPGQTVNIAVSDRRGHDQIAGASVYYLKDDNLTIKRGSENYTALIGEYVALIQSQGTLIGTTDDNGTLPYQFAEAGSVLLAATKDGFIPGFSRLTIASAPKKALAIKSPSSTTENETVTFTITEKDSGQAVAGSQLYARRFAGNSLEGGLDKLFGLFGNKPNGPGSDNKSISIPGIKESGILLGTSDAQGQVSYAFTTAGRYFLMAVSDNYSPGYAMISVGTPGRDIKPRQQQLTVSAPQTSTVGQQVTITVSDNSTPVAGATVNILTIKNIGVKKPMPTVSNSQNNHSDLFGGKGNRMGIFEASKNVPQNNGNAKGADRSVQCVDNGTVIQDPWSNRDANGKVISAGTTDSNGQVVYTFSSAGQYQIAVYKNGYKPASTKITITQ